MTELLLLSDLDEPYRENVVLIKDSALSLLSVLNQIIDYVLKLAQARTDQP